ncbi:hypothetical protein [Spongiibacter tropicus]|uniref:hypothetical protein n=1 Tax=Spongiibacter tropicus TaxID=454602 RepID=UPI0023568A71|nr:hypothetical protein [Spongiibacter tropicus]
MEMAVATMNATFRIIGMLAFTLIISGMPIVAQLSGGRSGVANAVLPASTRQTAMPAGR